jgi:AAA+ ATPase superfamily predicted ATPase
MKNPFRFERPHSAKQLLGREEELDRIVEAATHGGRVFVSGERGVGKTSLLEAVVSRIKEEKKVLPIFIGLRDLLNVETLAETILVAVAGTVTGEKKVVSLLKTYFGFLVSFRQLGTDSLK